MNVREYWKPDDPDFILNPYPNYHKLREEHPVFQSTSGDYIVLGYHAVRKGLIDKSFEAATRTAWLKNLIAYAKKKGKDYTSITKTMQSFLVQMNPPEHTELRRVLSAEWPKKDELIQMIDPICEQTIQNLPQEGDLVIELSKTLPLKVVNEILGYHQLDLSMVEDGGILLSALNPYLTVKDLDRINAASQRLYAHFETFFASLSPETPGLAGRLKAISLKGEHPNLDWVSVTLSLFIAAFETTRSLLSSLLHFLLTHPNYHTQLRDDRYIENFIHEILRLEAPIQMTGRVNTSDAELQEVKLPPRSGITLCIGSANRDPEIFENPDEIDLERDNHQHLSFGAGIHHCLGSQIAMLESKSLVKHIIPVLSRLQLKEDISYDPLVTIRNISSLKYYLHDT